MPAIRRTIKKSTYAILFVLVLLLPVLFSDIPKIFTFGQPKTAPANEPASVVIERVDTVIHGDRADIVARIRNPNPRAGVVKYPITFILLGRDDSEIKRLTKTVYLLPGSLNYVATLDVPLSSSLLQVRVEAPDQPQFVAVNEAASLPTFNSFVSGRSRKQIGPRSIEVQKGVVTNTSTLGFRRVDITGVAFDESGAVIGIGQTFIGEFAVGEQREFSLEWPVTAVPIARVIILPTTNIFRADNILEVIGDPSLLR
jgi:hypothetical protein